MNPHTKLVGEVKQTELDYGRGDLDTQCAKPCSLPRGSGGIPP